MRHLFLLSILACSSISLLPSASFAGPTEEASALADQAFAKYEAGLYAEAVSLYMQAYEKSVDARILFNVAQIYDKKVQDRDLAIDYYRRYLKSTTTEPGLVVTATERITELLRQQQSEPTPKPPPVETPTVPPPQEPAKPASPEAPSPPFFIGWIVTGVLGAGAVVTGSLALDASSELDATTYAGPPSEEADSLASRAEVLGGLTDGLIAGGLVAGTITLVLQLTYKPAAAKSTGVWVIPTVGSGVAGVTLGGVL